MDDMEQKALRVIDANINRLREGLRVVEDVCRFMLDDEDLSQRLKAVRHQVRQAGESIASYQQMLQARDAASDVGASISNDDERARDDVQRIFAANIKRAQECCRVLEEFAKLYDGDASAAFKAMRYDLYTLEKDIFYKMEVNNGD